MARWNELRLDARLPQAARSQLGPGSLYASTTSTQSLMFRGKAFPSSNESDGVGGTRAPFRSSWTADPAAPHQDLLTALRGHKVSVLPDKT
jgi:hypothetical protein